MFSDMKLPASLTEEFKTEWGREVRILSEERGVNGELLMVEDLATSRQYEVYLFNEERPELREAMDLRIDIVSGLGSFSAYSHARFSRAWCKTFERLEEIGDQRFPNRTLASFWCNLVKDFSIIRSEGVGTLCNFGPHQLGLSKSGELKMAGYFIFTRLNEENVERANHRTIGGLRSILYHLTVHNSSDGLSRQAHWLRHMGNAPMRTMSDVALIAEAIWRVAEWWERA